MIKPLDSGLRRAAPGVLPSHRIQDFLPINDGAARIKVIKGCRSASISSSSFQRKLESTPAWMQVVEPRLEQAAEEGDDEVSRETLIQSELP